MPTTNSKTRSEAPESSARDPVVTIEPNVVVVGQKASEKRLTTSAPAPKRKKAKAISKKDTIDATKEAYVSEWNVGPGDTIFGTTGAQADSAELLWGFFCRKIARDWRKYN